MLHSTQHEPAKGSLLVGYLSGCTPTHFQNDGMIMSNTYLTMTDAAFSYLLYYLSVRKIISLLTIYFIMCVCVI